MVIVFTCFTLSAFPEISGSPNSGIQRNGITLDAPGNVTNLFCLRRGIYPGSEGAWQERYWLKDKCIYLRKEELNISREVQSLMDIPEPDWQKAITSYELVKTEKGVYSRTGNTRQSEEAWMRFLLEYKQKYPDKGIPPPPLAIWRTALDYEQYLSERAISVEACYPSRLIDQTGRLTMCCLPDLREWKNRYRKAQYDPTSQLMLEDCEWANQKVVFKAKYEYDREIDTNIFPIVNNTNSSIAQIPKRLAGIGVALEISPKGPFIVKSVMPGGPAEQSGIRVGDSIVAIDETNTRTLLMMEAVKTLRNEDGADLKLDVQSSSNGQTNRVVIKRVVIDALDWVPRSSTNTPRHIEKTN